jgi:uncharacterized protein DUF2255
MAWTAHELETIGNADELQVASQRSDGSLRRYVTIWVVRDHDDLYVRSAYGRDAGWFRRAASSGKGAIRAWESSATSGSKNPNAVSTNGSTPPTAPNTAATGGHTSIRWSVTQPPPRHSNLYLGIDSA